MLAPGQCLTFRPMPTFTLRQSLARQGMSPCYCTAQGRRMLQADENWQHFWGRYQTSKPSHMSGWVGHFASHSPSGADEQDVRFQDTWLRAFQEKGEDGRFQLKMIRKADQDAKSWPRAGRERPDGNDETALEGTEQDSSFSEGFWHPYGRGNDSLPPSRVVCFGPDAVAQVTLELPSVEAISSAQEWDFVGSSEITFMDKEKRNILTVTYKGGGGGSILFHQASWDPVFLADIDPEEPLDLGKLLADEVPGDVLLADMREWPIREGAHGTAYTLRYLKNEKAWERLPPQAVEYSHPDVSDGQVLYRYRDGMYGLYPKTIGVGEALTFQAGVQRADGSLYRYTAIYHEDRIVDSVVFEVFH